MADAAQVVEGMGADVVDINMGCPVPKIAKHNAGCSLMREPEHAATRCPRDGRRRADSGDGEDARRLERARDQRAALARMVEDAGAVGGLPCMVGRRRSPTPVSPTGRSSIHRVAASVSIPVFGSGDCVEPDQVVLALRDSGVSGVLVGRGALRNPWIFSQAATACARRRRGRLPVSLEERGQFLLDYIDLLLKERVGEQEGFRHVAPGLPAEAAGRRPAAASAGSSTRFARSGRWYTKGLDGGSAASRHQLGRLDADAEKTVL